MGIGAVSATGAALDRAGLTLDEIDLIELNEAFAAQVPAVLHEWKVDPLDERISPNGSAISLGHPVGATGARILATAAHEAKRRDAGHVLDMMCIGGGQVPWRRSSRPSGERGGRSTPPSPSRSSSLKLPRVRTRCETPRSSALPLRIRKPTADSRRLPSI